MGIGQYGSLGSPGGEPRTTVAQLRDSRAEDGGRSGAGTRGGLAFGAPRGLPLKQTAADERVGSRADVPPYGPDAPPARGRRSPRADRHAGDRPPPGGRAARTRTESARLRPSPLQSSGSRARRRAAGRAARRSPASCSTAAWPRSRRACEELRGHPVVINKWASWCDPCRAEFPAFQRVATERGREVAFLGLNAKDSRRPAERFLAAVPDAVSLLRRPGRGHRARARGAGQLSRHGVPRRRRASRRSSTRARTAASKALEADIDRYLGTAAT